jgi:hypothetical protein
VQGNGSFASFGQEEHFCREINGLKFEPKLCKILIVSYGWRFVKKRTQMKFKRKTFKNTKIFTVNNRRPPFVAQNVKNIR